MWSRIASFSAFALVAIQPLFALGQSSSEPASGLSLLGRTNWVRLEVVGGRIAVLTHRCGQSRSASSDSSDPTQQRLNVQLRGSMLVMRYESEDQFGRREMVVDDDGTLRITALRYEADPREVTLHQPLHGKLTVSIESGGSLSRTSAPSLWHLMLAEPQLCEQHVAPLLESLRPDWRIAEQGEAIRQSLLTAAGSDVLAERAQWRKWVADLSHTNFQKRQAADRALRAVGQPVTAWLSRLDGDELDAEQRQRVRRICDELADPSADSPERVVSWLIDDKSVWLSLIATGDLDERIAASEHLSKICRRTIPFDPHADHDQRRTQMRALMARYGE